MCVCVCINNIHSCACERKIKTNTIYLSLSLFLRVSVSEKHLSVSFAHIICSTLHTRACTVIPRRYKYLSTAAGHNHTKKTVEIGVSKWKWATIYVGNLYVFVFVWHRVSACLWCGRLATVMQCNTYVIRFGLGVPLCQNQFQ